MNPLQRRHQVPQARVGGFGELLAVLRQVHVAQNVQPVVDGHEDHVPGPAQVEAVEGVFLHGVAGHEPAAVDPHEHGLFPVALIGRGPDVQVLAVLALLLQEQQAPIHGEGGGVPHLGRDGPVHVGVLHALPGLGLHGPLEPFGVGVLDAHEHVHIPVADAPELAVFSLYHRLYGIERILTHRKTSLFLCLYHTENGGGLLL